MLTCFFSIQKIFRVLVFWGLLVILSTHKVTLVYSFTDILSRNYYNVGGPLICTTYSPLKLPVLQGRALQLPILGVGNGEAGSLQPGCRLGVSTGYRIPTPPALGRDGDKESGPCFPQASMKITSELSASEGRVVLRRDIGLDARFWLYIKEKL